LFTWSSRCDLQLYTTEASRTHSSNSHILVELPPGPILLGPDEIMVNKVPSEGMMCSNGQICDSHYQSLVAQPNRSDKDSACETLHLPIGSSSLRVRWSLIYWDFWLELKINKCIIVSVWSSFHMKGLRICLHLVCSSLIIENQWV
jgi:hypothetical protein